MMLTNEGLKSRFETWVPFEDWTSERAADFVLKQATAKEFKLVNEEKCSKILEKGFEKLRKRPGWGNGRDSNTMLNKILRHRDIRVARNEKIHTRGLWLECEDFEKAVKEFLESRAVTVEAIERAEENLDHQTRDQTRNTMSIKQKENRKEKEKEKDEEEEEGDDPEDPKKTKDDPEGIWNGMDVETELKPVNNIVEKWSKEELDQLLDGGENGTFFSTLMKELVNQRMNEDEARRVAKKYLEALNLARKQEMEARNRERLQNRRAYVQCAVCGRGGYYWAACWVAPRITHYEQITLEKFEEMK